MKPRILWSIVVIAVVGLAASLSAVWTDTWPVAVADSNNDSAEADLEAAAQDYAAVFDVDLAEARERSVLIEAVRPVVTELRDKASETLAGVWLTHEPELAVRVRMTVEPSENVQAILDQSPLPVIVSTDAPLSYDESQSRLDQNRSQLRSAIPELQTTSIDERTGEALLRVYADPQGDIESVKDRIESVASSLRVDAALPVRVEYLDSPVTAGHTYGGPDLEDCTAGFVVEEDLTGTLGLLTAGHCNDSNTYYGFGSDGTYNLTFEDEDLSSTADAQWHTDSHWKAPEFYANSTSSRRTVASVKAHSSMIVGEAVCHRGKTTGYSCGQIKEVEMAPVGACPVTTCDDTWVSVEQGQGETLACWRGDSGGPWFIGTSAYGIYLGQSTYSADPGECNFAMFMAVDPYLDPLGVEVLVD